jgi:hypothetical protein
MTASAIGHGPWRRRRAHGPWRRRRAHGPWRRRRAHGRVDIGGSVGHPCVDGHGRGRRRCLPRWSKMTGVLDTAPTPMWLPWELGGRRAPDSPSRASRGFAGGHSSASARCIPTTGRPGHQSASPRGRSGHGPVGRRGRARGRRLGSRGNGLPVDMSGHRADRAGPGPAAEPVTVRAGDGCPRWVSSCC